MTRFYRLRTPRDSAYSGVLDAEHRWHLPGLKCPDCQASWAGGITAYPGVDLSALSERDAYVAHRPEPLAEFIRLRELVRPLVPAGAQLLPGASFGPLVGTATGVFSPLFLYYFEMPLVTREALARLLAEGVRGLKGFPTQLCFDEGPPPELLELEVLPHGRLHPDCTPERPPACPTCGRDAYRFPDEPLLDAATLPTHTDLFRLSDFETILIGTERFVEVVRRLNLDEVELREMPVR